MEGEDLAADAQCTSDNNATPRKCNVCGMVKLTEEDLILHFLTLHNKNAVNSWLYEKSQTISWQLERQMDLSLEKTSHGTKPEPAVISGTQSDEESGNPDANLIETSGVLLAPLRQVDGDSSPLSSSVSSYENLFGDVSAEVGMEHTCPKCWSTFDNEFGLQMHILQHSAVSFKHDASLLVDHSAPMSEGEVSAHKSVLDSPARESPSAREHGGRGCAGGSTLYSPRDSVCVGSLPRLGRSTSSARSTQHRRSLSMRMFRSGSSSSRARREARTTSLPVPASPVGSSPSVAASRRQSPSPASVPASSPFGKKNGKLTPKRLFSNTRKPYNAKAKWAVCVSPREERSDADSEAEPADVSPLPVSPSTGAALSTLGGPLLGGPLPRTPSFSTPGRSQLFACDLCGRVWKGRQGLSEHVRLQHADVSL